jgi:hypothetical protein
MSMIDSVSRPGSCTDFSYRRGQFLVITDDHQLRLGSTGKTRTQ